MHTAFLHTHSSLRWIVLILLVIAIVNAIMKKGKNEYTNKDRLLNLFTMITFHIQILLGFVLYFTSDKVGFGEGWMADKSARFYGMEHILIMVIGMALITIGHSKSKKGATPAQKNKSILIFYTITLVLVLAGIPWAFRGI